MPPHFLLACPLPADLLSGAKLGAGTPSAQASSSEKLGVTVWCINTTETKHPCFIFRFHPDSTWDCIQTGFIVFLQCDTSSHFKLMLSPTVCDCFVAKLSDLPRERALFTSPLLAFASVDFYSTYIPVRLTIFREKLLCLGYWAGPRTEFRNA